MILEKIKKAIRNFNAEKIIIILAIFLGSFGAWRVYGLGLMKFLTDQNAHLNFSRFVLDSMTPGINQIGFWPPLLHFLMLPAVSLFSAYESGWSGFGTLLPFLAIGAFFLFRLCFLVTGDKAISFTASLLFITNPYILYYTATPMMEVLFTANLIMTAYFTALWLKKDQLNHLLLIGVFVSLAVLSRFEGLILIPITVLIVLAQLVRRKKKYYQIEAMMILFLLLTVAGAALVFAYSWRYGGNPLIFSDVKWWLRDPLEAVFPGKGNILVSLEYILYAAFYMIAKPLVLLSLASFGPLFFISRKKFETFSVLLILFSPVFFIAFALFRGAATIYVPDLSPIKEFHNDRYSLPLIAFAILSIMFFLNSLRLRLKSGKPAVLVLKFISLNVLPLILIAGSFYRLYFVSMVDNFKVIRSNINIPRSEQKEIARYLAANYDYGKILTTRSDNDPIIAEAGIPLRNYIYEGNYYFYGQTIKEPWFFARWVIMHNPSGEKDKWAMREPVFSKWGGSDVFDQYYDLVLENSKRKLYKINEDMVRETAYEQNHDASRIPSVNAGIAKWNPELVYSKIQTPPLAGEIKPLPPKSAIESKIFDFYASSLKRDYENGFYADSEKKGSSESQSYALLQSYWAGDKETFDKVWLWTKENIRRKNDSLFSWKFSYDQEKKEIRILDENSATDADTDIAYALLKAGEDWNRPDYIKDAVSIIKDLWKLETIKIRGKRYVTAGNWASDEDKIIVNPSYFSPFAYRLFAEYDAANNWESLTDEEYATLTRASGKEIRNSVDIFLPPDWAIVDKKTGKISPYVDKSGSEDYSYDAFRVPWRVAMDNLLHPNKEARLYLEQIKIFAEKWDKKRRACSVYNFNGDTASCYTNVGALAGTFAVFAFNSSKVAERILEKYYLPGGDLLKAQSMNFYDKSWYWFALMFWVKS